MVLLAGDITNWYQSSKGYVKGFWVALSNLSVVGDVTNWYQIQGFNTKPG
jgi:hypothetical protein